MILRYPGATRLNGRLLLKIGKKRMFLAKAINSKYLYLVLLVGILLALLLALQEKFTGFLSGFVPVFAIPASFAYIIFFILPGFLTARQLVIRDIINKKHLLLLSIVFSSLIAYIVFWIYLFNNIVGQIVSVAVILACAALVIIRFKKFKNDILDSDFITPLTLMFIAGCIYLSILFLYSSLEHFLDVANSRFVHQLPGDNVLSFVFMDRVYNGQSLANFVEGWLASDRPPLFSTMLLILLPLNIYSDVTIFYQFVGTFIQCMWIPAIYSLGKFFAFKREIRNFIIASAVFSGVFIINSTYLWPKLPTITFFTLLFLLVFELADQTKISKKNLLISMVIGISAALGVLVHSGVAFSFIALGLALLITEKRMNLIKHAVCVFIPFFAVYIPWSLFQKLVVPPGNYLLKWHFAGMIHVNDYTFSEAMYISYIDRPIGDIFNKTIANILHMFPAFPDGYMSLYSMKSLTFFKLFGMPLVLNAFLIVLVLYFLYNYCIKKAGMSYKNKVMLYFTIFSFTIWPLLMYSYEVTNINLGSYFNIMLIYILIAFGAKHTNKELRNLLFIIHMILFVVLWVLDTSVSIFEFASLFSLRMLIVVIATGILFFVYLHNVGDLEDEPL